MKKIKLSFSNKFFETSFYQDVTNLSIKNYGLVINLDKQDILLDDDSFIKLYKSYLLRNYQLNKVKKALVITFAFDPTKENKALNNFCKKNWDSNKIRYPHNPEKWPYPILRSPVHKMGNWEILCWFLPANTVSSIHKKHPFKKEVHTQIYGLGIMNKFKEEKPETFYQKMYMPPGFTHDLFYDKDYHYPWHQYEAISASIWLAITEY